MKNKSSSVILSLVIKKLKIPVTHQSVNEELQKHPDPYSLAAISDILDHWLVPNAAYNASLAEIIETEIPLPFVACLRDGTFSLVSSINEQQVILSDEHGNNHHLETAEFRKLYKGTILAFQKDTLSGESDYARKRRKELAANLRIPFVFAGLTIILLLLLLSAPNNLLTLKGNIGCLFLFKSAGLATSVLLLIQSLDANNPLVRKFCGSDENQNCNVILVSKAAKLSDELSWSEVGFFYFAGTWLTVLLNSNNGGVMGLLALINLLALPYTFYSIYYQWRIANQWCVFCCTIQALLWFEFFAFMPHLGGGILYPVLGDYGKLLIGLLLPVTLWVFVKPLLIDSGQLKLLRPELYRFKYNRDFFKNTLDKETRYLLPPEDDSIVIGNRKAGNIITIVSSPFCNACADVHRVMDELIDIRDDVKLQFVFLTRIYSRDLDKKVLTHFMHLKSLYDDSGVKSALKDWYNQKTKNYDVWRGDHPVNEFHHDSDEIANQKAWCKMVGITGTPTLFVNGRKLPNPYKPEDIKYLI